MSPSLDGVRPGDHPAPRTVCDLCGADSCRPRGAACRTCVVGVLRYRSELQLIREERSRARREAAARLEACERLPLSPALLT